MNCCQGLSVRCEPPFLRFDFVPAGGMPLEFADPVEVIVAERPEEVRPALRAVQEAVRERGCWAAGYVSYEAAPAFDTALEVWVGSAAVPPLLWFGVFRSPRCVPYGMAPESGPVGVSEWQPSLTRDEYAQRVRAVKAAIADGMTYQVNLTMRLRARFTGDDFAWYRALRDAQRASYAAYLNFGRWRILSASPELFFRWSIEHGRIVTRPMKGTSPRGRWLEEDERRADALRSSAKERAENVMIVDLLRSDLGRIATPGTVTVPELFTVETYPTVLQMTSAVEAAPRPGTTLEDIFAALFPCGSVTGAPKVATMGLIADLEDSPRGVYSGAIGYVSPGGEAVFNVAIRTVVVDVEAGTAEYGVGGGVTWDSTADAEYAEIETKAAILREPERAFDLLETLRLERGEYDLLERHLARLSASARHFGIPLDEARVRTALDRYAEEHSSMIRRVRLLLSPNGTVRIEGTSFDGMPPEEPLLVALARTPVSRSDRFLYHKTTRRAVYDERRREGGDGVFDVLMQNEEGELTEFTTGNVAVEMEEGTPWWTPPRECGLLAGTLRGELLERGELREKVLRIDDLVGTSNLYFLNSVRGVLPVHLVRQ
jgi:para-aminobenzoate synthetase/4-amino-4-deoxychorismate lyase